MDHQTDNNNDEEISILTCIEDDYDFQAINTKDPISTNSSNSQEETLQDPNILYKYENIKYANASSTEINNQQKEDNFFDCSQVETYEEFHDCLEEPYNQKSFHLPIDYQYLSHKGKGSQSNVKFLKSYQVDETLTDLEWSQLIGEQMPFNTLAFAVTISQKYHKLEQLQPMILYKPIEVIKKILEATTQWATVIITYPLQHHHASRFPWNNKSKLQEEVATDTYFC